MSVHDDLLALCRAMHDCGERITYETLRARRGHGSRRDLARALRAWRQLAPDVPLAAPGRPSQIEMRLRAIIQRQRATIREQAHEIRVLQAEAESLGQMVRKYRGYPEDLDEFG